VAGAYAGDILLNQLEGCDTICSVIDERAHFGYITLDISPSLREAVERGLRIAQEVPMPKYGIYHEPENRRTARYKILEVPSEKCRWPGQPQARCGQKGRNLKQVNKSSQWRSRQSGGEEDVIWITIPFNRKELRRMVW
jgi:hypothetical protein